MGVPSTPEEGTRRVAPAVRARGGVEGRSGAARGSEMATGEALFERVVQATGKLSLFSKRPRAAVDPLLASGGSRPGGGEQGW